MLQVHQQKLFPQQETKGLRGSRQPGNGAARTDPQIKDQQSKLFLEVREREAPGDPGGDEEQEGHPGRLRGQREHREEDVPQRPQVTVFVLAINLFWHHLLHLPMITSNSAITDLSDRDLSSEIDRSLLFVVYSRDSSLFLRLSRRTYAVFSCRYCSSLFFLSAPDSCNSICPSYLLFSILHS